MGLFNHFPYPDTHQLNLDWILDTVKNCVDKVTELWTYVKEPGTGIQKALTDALTAADNAAKSAAAAKTSESNADGHAVDAQSYADTAEGAESNATARANEAAAAAVRCTQFAGNAQAYATAAAKSASEAAATMQTAFNALYPSGALFIYYPAPGTTTPDDATIIDALDALCGSDGGSWGRSDLEGNITTEEAAKTFFLLSIRTDDNNLARVEAPVFVRV